MTTKNSAAFEVRAALQAFQDGYTRRDPRTLDEFMTLFVPDDDLEVIGTNALEVGAEEWCLGPAMVRDLVENDWMGWGDVRIQVEAASIHTLGDAAWLAAPGTVSSHIDAGEAYTDYVDYIRALADDEGSEEEKLLRIQAGIANLLHQVRLGEEFTWPFRFTAVLVRREGRWLFHQVQFSFPTTAIPDERILSPSGKG